MAAFLPARAEVDALARARGGRVASLNAAFYHGGEPIRVIRPFLEGAAPRPFLLAMTAAGQSALNIAGLDTVVIYDARYANVIERGRNVLTRQYLGANELLQMAGRGHGPGARGGGDNLTDRDVGLEGRRPTPPEVQAPGDSGGGGLPRGGNRGRAPPGDARPLAARLRNRSTWPPVSTIRCWPV